MILNLTLLLSILMEMFNVSSSLPILGAWQTNSAQGETVTMIITENHFVFTAYKKDPPEFIYTAGGTWKEVNGNTISTFEFHTADPKLVGTANTYTIRLPDKNTMITNDISWKRIDKGKPGKLKGAWLITGRKREEEISMRTPGARKTMKILSGTRFQWIAYNSETGEFFGTGGGTYTTKGKKYTENIEFFSRDNTRVGASLEFNYEIRDGAWHHSGFSSKGDPLYEVWETRKSLGI